MRTTPRRRRPAGARSAGQAGFTLLEVLVALVILSIAIVASIEGFAQGLRLLKLAGDHQRAMLIADQKVREVLDPDEGREAGTEGAFRWERVTKAIVAPDLTPVGGGLPRGRAFEIDVRVSWDARRQIEVRTLRLWTGSKTGQTVTLTKGAGGGPGSGSGGTPSFPGLQGVKK